VESMTLNRARIHHIILFSCDYNSSFLDYVDKASECVIETLCDHVLLVWAPGQDDLVLPKDVAFPMTNYITLQIHYTNPEFVEGEMDSSGIRVWYNDVKPKYEAGIMQFGDGNILGPPLPHGNPAIHLEYSCPKECTNLFRHPLHIFGSRKHAHVRAWMSFSTVTSAATGITSSVSRVEFFDYHLQQVTPVDVVLMPGDRLNTHCFFNTAADKEDITVGLATTQEMCLEFNYYYPKISSSSCIYFTDGMGSNDSWCGNMDFAGVPNPNILDAPYWSLRTFGAPQATCPLGSSNMAVSMSASTKSAKAASIIPAALAALITFALVLIF